jgi:hypothetical protein
VKADIPDRQVRANKRHQAHARRRVFWAWSFERDAERDRPELAGSGIRGMI